MVYNLVKQVIVEGKIKFFKYWRENMFVFFLVVLLLIPLAAIFFGLLWRKNSPRKINWVYGYRTSWSMKSQETWDFAHKYAGRILLYIGVPLTAISVIPIVLFKNRDINTLSSIVLGITGIQIICLIVPFIPTEIALRKNFDKNGNRK